MVISSSRPLYILQRGVQWKQGVVICMVLYTSLLYNTTPIHCTLLPLHPPVMSTQPRVYSSCNQETVAAATVTTSLLDHFCANRVSLISLELYILTGECILLYIYIYIYIYRMYTSNVLLLYRTYYTIYIYIYV